MTFLGILTFWATQGSVFGSFFNPYLPLHVFLWILILLTRDREGNEKSNKWVQPSPTSWTIEFVFVPYRSISDLSSCITNESLQRRWWITKAVSLILPAQLGESYTAGIFFPLAAVYCLYDAREVYISLNVGNFLSLRTLSRTECANLGDLTLTYLEMS